MTPKEIKRYVAEVEVRFRARTPSGDILSTLPEQRVGRSEMRTWFNATFCRDMTLDDTIQLELPLKQLFKRLKKAFPNELWEIK